MSSHTPGTEYPTWAGWLLHLYTASGAVFGILALQAVDRGEFSTALLWMVVAVLIDATDGTVARKLVVWELVPRIDGRTLDDIVDYFTYVLLPVMFLVKGGLISSHWIVWSLPVIASGFGFANHEAKTEDDYFLGFPSYWNIVAIYIFLFQWPVWVSSLIVMVLAVMVFVPICYIYPSKTKPFKALTLSLSAVWGVQLISALIWRDLPDWWLPASLIFPIYYTCMSLYLHNRRKAEKR